MITAAVLEMSSSELNVAPDAIVEVTAIISA